MSAEELAAAVLQMDKAKGIDLQHVAAYYEAKEVPVPDKFFMPVQCQHCENPPCVKTCPIGATWSEPDGIVVIDYDWCVGCRCCDSQKRWGGLVNLVGAGKLERSPSSELPKKGGDGAKPRRASPPSSGMEIRLRKTTSSWPECGPAGH